MVSLVYELIDSHFQKRYTFLEYIYSHQKDSIEVMELVKILDVSYPTAKRIILDVREDIRKMDFEDSIEIIDLAEQKRIFIKISDSFSINLVRLFYLEKSVRFQLFSLFLTPRKWTQAEIIKKLNITYSVARKELAFLKKYISKYAKNISLNTKKSFYIAGDEITTRMFYTGIFQQVYGGYKWPFHFINLTELYEILEKLSPDLYGMHTNRFTLIHYGVAITLLRCSKKPIADNVYYWEPSSAHEINIFNEFVSKLHQKIPTITLDSLRIEAKFLISCLFTHSLAYQVDEVPTFFKESKILSDMNFLDQIEKKLEFVEQYSLSPLTAKERDLLRVRLVGIFYQIFIYGDVLKQRVLDLYVHHPFDFPSNSERERSFYHILMRNYSEKEKGFDLEYVEYICAAYYKLLFFEMDRHLYHPKIKVLILSNRSPEVLISSKLQTVMSYFYIEIVYNLSEKTDLIISDMAISKHNLTALPEKIPVVIIEESLPAKDVKSLQEVLTKISDDKYRQMKDLG